MQRTPAALRAVARASPPLARPSSAAARLVRAWALGCGCAAVAASGAAVAACGAAESDLRPLPPPTNTAAVRPGEVGPADALATRVARVAGIEALAGVSELRFTFVVTRDDERRMEVGHRWDLRAQRDRIRWVEDGRTYDLIVDLRTREAIGTVDGAPVAADRARELGERAYARWVNDTYWLTLPLKLLDPGVRRTLEPPREFRGRRYEILGLSFDGVGLTPGDRYWLYIDPETGRIVRWEMALQGATGEPQGTSFEDYRSVGPLQLSLDHVTDDGRLHIRFEGVEALPEVDPRDFQLRLP
jgi:hypothetical protein